MDILYILGSGSKKDNLELRMSLRSISKYGTNVGRVIVAGTPPKWLSKEVEQVEVRDKYSYKHQNILNCIESVIDQGIVEGEFLYSSDDHFYVRPVDFDKYPYFFKCELRRSVNRTDPFYQYHKSLYDTYRLCKKHGLPTDNYSQHCNTHMHTEVFRMCRDIIHESYQLPYGVEPTSLLMNFWQTLPNPPKAVLREDVKVLSANNIFDIYKQIGNRDCFSIGDSVFSNQAIYDFFEREYNIKSIFEKN